MTMGKTTIIVVDTFLLKITCVIGIVLVVALCVSIPLFNACINEMNGLRAELRQYHNSLVNMNAAKQLPVRVNIHYIGLDKKELLFETQDDIMTVGNEKIDKALRESFANYREGNLVCPCHRPEVWITEHEKFANIFIVWYDKTMMFIV